MLIEALGVLFPMVQLVEVKEVCASLPVMSRSPAPSPKAIERTSTVPVRSPAAKTRVWEPARCAMSVAPAEVSSHTSPRMWTTSLKRTSTALTPEVATTSVTLGECPFAIAEFSAWTTELTVLAPDVCVTGSDARGDAWPRSLVGTSDAGSFGVVEASLEASGAPAHAPDMVEIVRNNTTTNTARRPVFRRKLALNVNSHVKHT